MATKAELQKENETLRGLVTPSTTISHCTVTMSPSDETCYAVGKIADALKEAARALIRDDTGIHLGDKHYHNEAEK